MSNKLQVPPKKWRSSQSLQALAGHVKAQIVRCDLGFNDRYRVDIGRTQAQSILEALCQATHTERSHGN